MKHALLALALIASTPAFAQELTRDLYYGDRARFIALQDARRIAREEFVR